MSGVCDRGIEKGHYQPGSVVWYQLVRQKAAIHHLARIVFLHLLLRSAGAGSGRVDLWLRGGYCRQRANRLHDMLIRFVRSRRTSFLAICGANEKPLQLEGL